ncbi:MAG: transcriptional repressor [Tissierellia bacterium]|nr:transcriptional repressor [Tissierellia bacterium]
MAVSFEELTKELKSKNIRLSHQRLKILEFIYNNKIHPTVDEIYKEIQKEIPTLSKTTVYNSLNALIDAGLVKVITIGEHESRYDIVTENHGHFKCDSCDKIIDFEIDIDAFASKELKDFEIIYKDVYFKGLCPDCNKMKNKNLK